MREYHQGRRQTVERFLVLYLRGDYSGPPEERQPRPPNLSLLWDEFQHHGQKSRLAGAKWRRMQAKAKRRREKQCAS
jgi:hypothetical protein